MECVYSNTCPLFNSNKCNTICPYYLITHGANGKGGYWGNRNVPKKYENLRVNDLPQHMNFDVIRKYISKLEQVTKDGVGLYLYSNPSKDNPFGTGTGKTTSAVTILNEYTLLRSKQVAKKVATVETFPTLFIKASDFQNIYNRQFRDNDSTTYYHYKDRMKDVELLVLDDVAIRNGTDAFINELYEIIDYRSTEEMVTIYTSNLKLDKLTELFGHRIVSRIDGATHQIPFEGKDNRKKTF